MAVPKRRTSHSRKTKRRSHINRVEPVATIRCGQCNQAIVPHRVCGNCGHYRGRDILAIDLTSA